MFSLADPQPLILLSWTVGSQKCRSSEGPVRGAKSWVRSRPRHSTPMAPGTSVRASRNGSARLRNRSLKEAVEQKQFFTLTLFAHLKNYIRMKHQRFEFLVQIGNLVRWERFGGTNVPFVKVRIAA